MVEIHASEVTHTGIKRAGRPNEDARLCATSNTGVPVGLFVVADGMGGYARGEVASAIAVNTILKGINGVLITDASRLLEAAVQKANEAVWNEACKSFSGMGTTVTAALVTGHVAYVANVGDSRTYILRSGETIARVTSDHSMVNTLVKHAIITDDDVYTHPQRNQIYRSLGGEAHVEVDTFKVEVKPGDRLLLCSDGLWEMVRDPEIQQILSQAATPEAACKQLLEAALKNGGDDNITAVVVFIV